MFFLATGPATLCRRRVAHINIVGRSVFRISCAHEAEVIMFRWQPSRGFAIVKSEHCPARTRTYSPSCTGYFRGFSGLSAYPVGGAPAVFADAALLPAPASLLTRSVSLASSAALPE